MLNVILRCKGEGDFDLGMFLASPLLYLGDSRYQPDHGKSLSYGEEDFQKKTSITLGWQWFSTEKIYGDWIGNDLKKQAGGF